MAAGRRRAVWWCAVAGALVAAATGIGQANTAHPEDVPKTEERATGVPATERVMVARSASAATPLPPVTLAKDDWNAFLHATRLARAEVADAARAAARARLRTAVDQTVEAMQAGIPAFADWRFSFFTTYRLSYAALSGTVTGGDATESVRAVLAERFQALVLDAASPHQRLIQALDDIAADVAARRGAFVAERRAALDRLAAERALPSDAGPIRGPVPGPIPHVVSEADALELPPLEPLRRHIAVDAAAADVGWLDDREMLVLAGRQAVRRSAGFLAEPALLATVPAPLLEATPFLVGPVVGAAVFGTGMAVEFAAVKLWESSERAALEAAAGEALDQYRDALLAGALPNADTIVNRMVGS